MDQRVNEEVSETVDKVTLDAHAARGKERKVYAPRSKSLHGTFGRMFRELAPWEPPGQNEEEKIDAIAELASSSFEAAGGSDISLDNNTIPAAYTYLGQFIDHDITFDPTSSLERRNDPDALVNFRTPRFDLDSVYGRGPADQPYLYNRASANTKMLIGANSRGEQDLPRNLDVSTDDASTDDFSRGRTALIGDMRNDENIIVSQLQLAFLNFHNARVDEGHSFDEAQRMTRWHYQWVVIHDFVKRICGAELVDKLLGNGTPNLRFYKYRNKPFMPVEFSVAAYRLGHSMVRPNYHLSDTLEGFRSGNALSIFGGPARDNLNGGRELPPFWSIQWNRFVSHEGSQPQHSRKLDTKLAPPLVNLPLRETDPRRNSLAFLNLLRGWRMSLPSGQDVAARMGISPLCGNDPLWLYVLQEADELGDGGRRLGPVGARIVAEVFVGLLAGDNQSYYSVNPNWSPELSASSNNFELVDFLVHAGVPMTDIS